MQTSHEKSAPKEPSFVGPNKSISEQILDLLLHYRRRDPGCINLVDNEQETVKRTLSPLLNSYIERTARIDFVLPAFPVKSPNPNKVLGRLPDMAERLSLASLASLCKKIQAIYSPGAHILICADGHVFADVIGVTDSDVAAYQGALEVMIDEIAPDYLGLFNLGDVKCFATAKSPRQLRDMLCRAHAESPIKIKQILLDSPHGTALYRAITRFTFEDRWIPGNAGSRTALQKEAKDSAIEVIRRSWAWGDLLVKEFPDAMRLSIHPQQASSPKLGIHMMPTHDNWLTPWHSVAVKLGDRFVLMKKHEAERLGGRVILLNRQPSYYQIEHAGLINSGFPPEVVDYGDPLADNTTPFEG